MYIKLKRGEKTPIEKWREVQYTKEQLAKWKGNIGFACGHDDVVVLDIDDKQRCAELGVDPYVDTYTVRTGSGGYHFYYRVPDCPIMRAYDPRDNVHIADVQALGTYVVCPPSIHPNGTPYTVFNDMPVLDLTKKELLGLLKNTTTHREVDKLLSAPRRQDLIEPFTIGQVWNLSGFKQVGEQLIGAHPVHGSKTGHNLVVKDDVWWCGRHRTGGGAKEALAVDCGLLECSEVKRGCLKGNIFVKLTIEAIRRKLV